MALILDTGATSPFCNSNCGGAGGDIEFVYPGPIATAANIYAVNGYIFNEGIQASPTLYNNTTAAIAAYTAVPKGTEIATVELSINYLEPVPGGRIKADARVLRAGRNFVATECEIFTEDGKLAAKALLTFGAAAGHTIQR
jgi:hypothetical protein